MNHTPEVNILREIKITEATVTLREDGIVCVFYHKNTFLNVELQLRMLEIFNEITGGKKTNFIFTADDGVVVTKAARDNAIAMEGQTPVLATAVVANNLAYRMIANFYVKVQKPKGKYKVVRDVEEGAKWLKSLDNEPKAQ